MIVLVKFLERFTYMPENLRLALRKMMVVEKNVQYSLKLSDFD